MVGGSLFFAFLDAADRGAIDTIWQKYTFRQKSGVSGIVCREKVKGIGYCGFWLKDILSCLKILLKYGKMVKAGYDLAKVKQFGKSGSFAKLCMGELIENNGKMTSGRFGFLMLSIPGK